VRRLGVLFVIVAAVQAYACQTASDAPDQGRDIVRRSLKSHLWQGFDEKVAARLGDAMAVAIVKEVAGNSLDDLTINTLLPILTSSFSKPQQIENLASREPRATLFLLNAFARAASSDETKKFVADARKEVLANTGYGK
jgi:hypothetical protein